MQLAARQFTGICNRISCNLSDLHKLLQTCTVLESTLSFVLIARTITTTSRKCQWTMQWGFTSKLHRCIRGTADQLLRNDWHGYLPQFVRHACFQILYCATRYCKVKTEKPLHNPFNGLLRNVTKCTLYNNLMSQPWDNLHKLKIYGAPMGHPNTNYLLVMVPTFVMPFSITLNARVTPGCTV